MSIMNWPVEVVEALHRAGGDCSKLLGAVQRFDPIQKTPRSFTDRMKGQQSPGSLSACTIKGAVSSAFQRAPS